MKQVCLNNYENLIQIILFTLLNCIHHDVFQLVLSWRLHQSLDIHKFLIGTSIYLIHLSESRNWPNPSGLGGCLTKLCSPLTMKTFYKQDFKCWGGKKNSCSSVMSSLSGGPSDHPLGLRRWRVCTYYSKQSVHKNTLKPPNKRSNQTSWKFSPSGKITPQAPRQLPKKISKYVTQAWEATGRWIPCQLESVMIGKPL